MCVGMMQMRFHDAMKCTERGLNKMFELDQACFKQPFSHFYGAFFCPELTKGKCFAASSVLCESLHRHSKSKKAFVRTSGRHPLLCDYKITNTC